MVSADSNGVDQRAAYAAANASAWDEIANQRASLDAKALWNEIDPRVFSALTGARELVHLQCGSGLQLARLCDSIAARCGVGIDVSNAQIEIARARFGGDSRLSFSIADVCADLPDGIGTFDGIFTGQGALVWLCDLNAWAKNLAELAVPGATLVVLDSHPCLSALAVRDHGGLEARFPVSSRGTARVSAGKWSHFAGAAERHRYLFDWSIGEVVSAVVRHGFAIESLVELPDGPELRRFAGQAGLVRGFPARFLLIARRQTI